METIQMPFTLPGRETNPKDELRPVAARGVPVVKPEIYARGRARCPRCRIEFLYDAILYPWCPGCCDRPG